MNTVNIIGRLTKNPELKYSPNGVAMVRFTVAVNRTYKNAQGEYEPDFISCVAFKKTAENIANYTLKGHQVAVEGSIQTGSYEKDGRKIYTTDVMANRVQFLERRGNDGSPQQQQPQQPMQQQYQQQYQQPMQQQPYQQQQQQYNPNNIPF